MLEKHTLIHCSRQVFNHGTYSISSYCMLIDILPFDCLFDKCPSMPCVLSPEALEDSKASLSGCIPTLNSKMTQHLTERCFRFLKSASEVPRLYRRTNKVRRPAPQASSSQDNGAVLSLGFNVTEMIREHLLYSTKILKSAPQSQQSQAWRCVPVLHFLYRKFPSELLPTWTTPCGRCTSSWATPKTWWSPPLPRTGYGSHSMTALTGRGTLLSVRLPV